MGIMSLKELRKVLDVKEDSDWLPMIMFVVGLIIGLMVAEKEK